MTPSVTVVVATRDREQRLTRLLAAIGLQTLPPAEVVIVDDGSTDNTPALLAKTSHTVVRGEGKGPGIARNLGWKLATSDLVAFTDDDCEPQPYWLHELVKAHRPGTVVQGRVIPNPTERDRMGPTARTLEITGPSPHFETANVLYERAMLEHLGGFDEKWSIASEDTDLGWRAMGAGAKRTFARDALVWHAVHVKSRRQTLRDAWRASDCVGAYAAHPHLKEHLQDGLWFHPSHQYVYQAALGVVIGRKRPAASAFVAPYAAHLLKRAAMTRSRPRDIPFFMLRDAVEIAATVHGAVKHRTVVL